MIPFSDIMKPSQNLKVVELSNILSNRQQIGTGLLRCVLTCVTRLSQVLIPKEAPSLLNHFFHNIAFP